MTALLFQLACFAVVSFCGWKAWPREKPTPIDDMSIPENRDFEPARYYRDG